MTLHRCGRRTAAQLLLLLAAPVAAGAQAPPPPARAALIRADVFVSSRYHWRGIRRSDAPVLHADAAGGVRLGQFSLTAGGWTGLELREADGQGHSDLRPGHWGLAEWDVWGQAAARLGPAILALGVLRSTYLRQSDHPAATEVYGSGRMHFNRFAASLGVWHGVRGAQGTYVEPSIAFHHFINPFSGPAVSWTTTAAAGVQIGRRSPVPGTPGATGTGLTHAALTSVVRLAVNVGPAAVVFAMSPVIQVSRDPATYGNGSDIRFWWPFQAGISWPLRRPE
jgi:hypothetical protein